MDVQNQRDDTTNTRERLNHHARYECSFRSSSSSKKLDRFDFVRSVRARSARISIVSRFHVSTMSFKLQKNHLISLTRITRRSLEYQHSNAHSNVTKTSRSNTGTWESSTMRMNVGVHVTNRRHVMDLHITHQNLTLRSQSSATSSQVPYGTLRLKTRSVRAVRA